MKVETFLADNQLKLTCEYTDNDDQVRQKLYEIGGKTQVPCLVIDGRPKYESDDIIDWLAEHKDELRNAD